MSRPTLSLTLVLIGSVLALGGLVIMKDAEEHRLRATITAYQDCDKALERDDLDGVAKACPATTMAIHRAWHRAERCDRALLEADLFTVRSSCSTEVMTLLAQRDAEAGRADRQTKALADTRADQAAAIARAEARVRTQTERTARAQITLDQAPRADDGLLVLDAGRLCSLRGGGDCPGP